MSKVNTITGFDVYKIYLALKNHYTKPEYDYVKYNGKVNVKESTFKARRDRWHFEKIAKKYKEDSFDFILSNLIENKKFWVGDAMNDRYHKIYQEWVGYKESEEYHFKKDIQTLYEYCEECNKKFDDLFFAPKGKHPIIYKLLNQGHIHYYTFCVLAGYLKFYEELDKKNSFDPIWKEESFRLKKTIPFCSMKNDYPIIIVDIFSQV